MNPRPPALLVLALLVVTALCVPCAVAEKVSEEEAITLLSHHPDLALPAASKTSEHAMTRLHFWVGKDGDVEAVEQVCGERVLFDEIVDAVLGWDFKPRAGGAFVTDIGFERQGQRVLLFLELPEKQRHRSSDCSASDR